MPKPKLATMATIVSAGRQAGRRAAAGEQVEIGHRIGARGEHEADRDDDLDDPDPRPRDQRRADEPAEQRRRSTQPNSSTGSTSTPSRIRKMMLSAIAGGVRPTSRVGGISRSGTMRGT